MKQNCKIGKVTYKAPNVRQLAIVPRANARDAMLSHANEIAAKFPEIDGYVILAWDQPKAGQCMVRVQPGAVRDMLDIPGFTADMVRWSFTP